jgi:hypothetical protein
VTRWFRPVVAVLLLGAMLCAAAVIEWHSHPGTGYRRDCPGCHQQRTLGSSSAAVAVQAVVFAPVPAGLAPSPATTLAPDFLAAFDTTPRGPPAA